MDSKQVFKEYIFPVLPPTIVRTIETIPETILEQVTEVRLRVNQPLLLVLSTNDVVCGRPVYYCTREDLARTMQLISKNSLYAFEQELKLGFLTIAGGHRVGLAGQAIVEGGEVKALKNISFMNIRLAREIKGCADILMPYLIGGMKQVYSSLVISPPRCGKTTMIRDVVRQISSGTSEPLFKGAQVGVVDERSEIAACQQGVPTVDIGQRVDVLDGCPKAAGMLMLIRSMSPQVIVVDEVGREKDVLAIKEALHAGVSVIATVHAKDIEDVCQRPFIGELVQEGFFERYIVLGNCPQPGTVLEICGANRQVLYSFRKGMKVCG